MCVETREDTERAVHVVTSHSVRSCVLCSAAIIYWLICRNYGMCVVEKVSRVGPTFM